MEPEPDIVYLDSSNLEWVQYFPALEQLVILFNPEDRKTGVRSGKQAKYQYLGVPKSVYDGLLAAPSHGKYFHAHIKDKYPFIGPY